MPWNEPLPTLANGGVPTAADINKYIENINWLHAPPKTMYDETNDASDITTVATTWAQISSSFNRSLTTVGASSLVLVIFRVVSQNAQFDLSVNGTRLGSAPSTTGEGSIGSSSAGTQQWTHIMPRLLVLAAGTHTLIMQWKAVTGTATIFTRFRPQFVAKVLV